MKDVNALLAEMTVEEKAGQLNMVAVPGAITGPGELGDIGADLRAGRIGSLLNSWDSDAIRAFQRVAVEESRLGIPLFFGLDVIHGHRTIFPVPLAETCAFDPSLWERTAQAAAWEAAGDGVDLTFAPMLDVARDPRWGRMVEGAGEDQWVTSQIAAAKVRGFQGGDLTDAGNMAATAKHFCAYGAVTAGREYASTDVSDRSLREIYIPPFISAMAAGAAAIMPAFTDIAGVPMTANVALLRGYLREELGFQGLLISDYDAIGELLNHGVAETLLAAAVLALKAGIDIDMMSHAYVGMLPEAVKRGLVAMDDLDASVRRVLTFKANLGLFDDPYRRCVARDLSAQSERNRQLAREAGSRSIVLLTRRNPVLPLSSSLQRIAVVGPLAAAAAEMLGSWAMAGRPEEAVSILDGLRAALPNSCCSHAPGCSISGHDDDLNAEALQLCQEAELVILCLGEAADMSGEAASRADLGLPGQQRAFAEAVLGLGKPTVVLLSSGRPLALPWLFERADAVLATWFLGTQAGHAIADVLTGKVNPSGKLPVTWPRHGGQVPIFYGQRPTGRPSKEGTHYSSTYLDLPFSPQFFFGHGLSYSVFELSDLRCTSKVKTDKDIAVSITVQNKSIYCGEATVFLFIRDVVASVGRPILELKGTKKLLLAAGESGIAEWRIAVSDLAFIGSGLQPVLEPGRFEIHVGQSADPCERLTAIVDVMDC